MSPDGESINKYVGDFIKTNVDNYLHIHKEDFTDILENKIKETERERKGNGWCNEAGTRESEESQPP